MTVLITVRNGQQTLGRCDATCYNCIGTRCRCVCHGFNHGVGLAIAQQNVTDFQPKLNALIKKRFPETTEILFITSPQQALFHAPQPNPHTLPTKAA